MLGFGRVLEATHNYLSSLICFLFAHSTRPWAQRPLEVAVTKPPVLKTENSKLKTIYVPTSQLFAYSICSGVCESIRIPIASSLSEAISMSTSSGSKCRPGASLP